MINFIQNLLKHKKITILIGLAILLIAGLWTVEHKITHITKNTKSPKALFDVRMPMEYSQPLVIATLNDLLNIQPINAKSSEMVKINENTVKYIDAYQNTDVEQIKYPNKLKESLILKGPDHPDRFEYKINIDDYLWEIDEKGNILFKQKEKEDRFKIDEIKDNHIKATMNIDYTDGHPIIFKIPAPYLIDSQGRKSDRNKVETVIKKDKFILTPDQEWLSAHQYPIILDPTVETVPREQEEVIIGDEYSAIFAPQVKLYKWGDEAYLSVESLEEGDDYFTRQGGKIIWQNTDRSKEYHFYPVMHNNIVGFEYEIILKEKIENNVIELELESQGLDFYYQPALNKEDHPETDYCSQTECIKDGTVVKARPEDVVGSYAVYHSEKRGDYTQQGGKNYKVGKAFHIYRPKIIDNNGQEIWGEMHIKNNILSIIILQDFLDTAEYPISVDPTFGYTTEGASNSFVAGQYSSVNYTYLWGTTFTKTGSAGTIDSVTAWLYSDSNDSGDIRVAVYDEDSEGSNSHGLVGQAENADQSITTTASEIIFTFSSESINAEDNYLLSIRGNGSEFVENALRIKYDAASVINYYYQDLSGAYAAFPDPLNLTESGTDVKYSIYCTYSNASPTISSVTDTPDPTNPNRSVTFIVDWSDSGDSVKAKVCDTDTLSNQNCGSTTWASSTAFTTADPIEIIYNVVGADAGQTRNYYAFVCDDEAACSSASSGTFTVNANSAVPNVKFR